MRATTRTPKARTKTRRSNEPMLVRIYPRDPKRGYHAARFQMRGSGYPIFKVERGWYQVDAATAERLSKYYNRNNDPTAKPVFQICTRAEAIALEEAEQEKIRRADARTPVPLPKGLAEEEVDWRDDMGSDEPVDSPRLGSKEEAKFVPMSELDVDGEEDDEEEFDLEDPPEIDLLSELDEEDGDLTTSDLKPKPRRSTKKAITKKRPSTKKVTKKKRRKASAKGKK